jgi:hypothetical protein
MDKFLYACDQPKMNQEDVNHPNRPTAGNEFEAVVKSLPTKKIPGPNRFTAEFYQNVKELTPTLLKLFREVAKEGTLPSSFFEASITVILTPDGDTIKKGNRSISSMNRHKNCQ